MLGHTACLPADCNRFGIDTAGRLSMSSSSNIASSIAMKVPAKTAPVPCPNPIDAPLYVADGEIPGLCASTVPLS